MLSIINLLLLFYLCGAFGFRLYPELIGNSVRIRDCPAAVSSFNGFLFICHYSNFRMGRLEIPGDKSEDLPFALNYSKLSGKRQE